MSSRNYELYLDEIKEAIESIMEYTSDMTLDDFVSDKKQGLITKYCGT